MIISYSLDNELIFEKEIKYRNICKFTGKLVVITLIALSFGNTITYAANPVGDLIINDPILRAIAWLEQKTPIYDGPPLKCFFPFDFDCFKYCCGKLVEAYIKNSDKAIRIIKFMNGGINL